MVRLFSKNWWLRAGNEIRGKHQSTLSNHRMAVNHHRSVDSKKGKPNPKFCGISSSDRQVLMPRMIQRSSRTSFGCQRALWPPVFKSQGLISWEEMEKLASFKKMTAKGE